MIFMFHNVVPDHLIAGQEHQSVSIKQSVFLSAIRQITSIFNVVSFESYLSIWKKNHCLPVGYAVISFDDLTRTTLDCAITILENQGIPSIGYAVTSQIDTDNLMWTAFINALCFDSHYTCLDIGDHLIPLDSVKSQMNARRLLISLAKESGNPLGFVKSLSSIYTLNSDQIFNYVGPTESQLQHYTRNHLFTLACHTHNHQYLSRLSYSSQYEEIFRSQSILSRISKTNVNHFSFPFGDYNDVTLQVLTDLNFATSCSVKEIRYPHFKAYYQIPRIGIYSDTVVKNLSKLILHWLSFRRLDICR